MTKELKVKILHRGDYEPWNPPLMFGDYSFIFYVRGVRHRDDTLIALKYKDAKALYEMLKGQFE